MLRIRDFKDSDVQSIIKLLIGNDRWMKNRWLLLFTLKYGKWIDRAKYCLIRKSLRVLFNNKYDRATFVAEENKIIGVLRIYAYLEDVWMIGLLIVNPECQRRGVATKLLEKATTYIRERNGKELRSIIEADNVAATKLYEKLGFKVTGKQFTVLLDHYG